MTVNDQKKAAALAALDQVHDGMSLGLGTGSTAVHFVHALAARVATGLSVVGVPTSKATERLAADLGISLMTLDDTPQLDLCVDGADEIDRDLNLIKGGGGALLREKIVARASARMIVIADESKMSSRLGGFPLPLEILPFGARATVQAVERAAAHCGVTGDVGQRTVGGDPYVTDNGNWIFDGRFRIIEDPHRLANALAEIPGLVDHGLFTGMADIVFVGTESGVERHGVAQGE